MIVIPAIDVIDGECVRLTGGLFEHKTVYEKDPVVQAIKFEEAGLTHLHLVDLDGAKEGRVKNWKVIENILKETDLVVDFGGGVKTEDEIKRLLDMGVDKITIGSLAVKNKERVIEFLEKYKDHLILGSDVKDGKIRVSGWLEKSETELLPFVSEYFEKGFRYCICTDISKDGMLKGPSFGLYEALATKVMGMNFIASGGISCLNDLIKLKDMGLYGTIVGKAYYEGLISLDEMRSVNFAQ